MILQFLLNYFLTEYDNVKFKHLYYLLEANNFDLLTLLKNAKPQDLAPLFASFFKNNKNNNATEDFSFDGVEPIINFADKRIVETLNAYLSQSI